MMIYTISYYNKHRERCDEEIEREKEMAAFGRDLNQPQGEPPYVRWKREQEEKKKREAEQSNV